MGSLCIYYQGSIGIISKKQMNEDIVALIMCKKSLQNTKSLKKKNKDLDISADIFLFLKDTSCFFSLHELSSLYAQRVDKI